MQTRDLPIRVPPASSFLPRAMGTLLRPLDEQFQRFFLPDDLLESLSRASAREAGEYADTVLRELNISYDFAESDLARIPASGPALLVSNHPFGFLEGLILLSALPRVRSDFRIVVNSVLATVKQLRQQFIFVNPFSTKDPHQNATGVRQAYQWLRSGGLLVIFPAGEVAHLNWGEHLVTDPKWSDTAARFARKANCPTVPMFFEGANSIPFQMVGTIHPSLRTLNLPRELMKKRSRTIRARVGSAISGPTLRKLQDEAAATDYLRARVYLLSSSFTAAKPVWTKPIRAIRKHGYAAIAEAPRTEDIVREVDAIREQGLLASGEEFEVYLASASEIPNALFEIGRCREMTFREVGEGSSRTVDLDRFDSYYKHLFLWHPKDKQIAGAYRIAATSDVLKQYGPKGLYTSTLFQYSPQFFDKLGNAFELGRSFIRTEYQRHYAPLLLLWKGIAKCIEQRPDCPVLFGAVSISSDYHRLSRALIVNFMTGHMAGELAEHVAARKSYRRPMVLPKHIKQLNSLVNSLDELSATVSDLEKDGKGVPVLLRHYLKLGGQFLGFNVDSRFSNTLDGLIFADLRTAPAPMLERCMGRSAAAAFRAWHQLPDAKRTL